MGKHDGEECGVVIRGNLGHLEITYQREVMVFGGY